MSDPIIKEALTLRAEHHDTIVTLWVSDGVREHPVYFDHRPFAHLWEAEEGGILGRTVNVGSDDDGQPYIEFLD